MDIAPGMVLKRDLAARKSRYILLERSWYWCRLPIAEPAAKPADDSGPEDIKCETLALCDVKYHCRSILDTAPGIYHREDPGSI